MTARRVFHAVVAIVLLCLLAAIFQQAIRVGQIEDTYTPMPTITDQQLPNGDAFNG